MTTAGPPAIRAAGAGQIVAPGLVSYAAMDPTNDPWPFTGDAPPVAVVVGGTAAPALGLLCRPTPSTRSITTTARPVPRRLPAAIAGRDVDLRAQVRDTSVSSYTWDTTAPHRRQRHHRDQHLQAPFQWNYTVTPRRTHQRRASP